MLIPLTWLLKALKPAKSFKTNFPLIRIAQINDCGVACLLTIIKFYKGYYPIEGLKFHTGTTLSGYTMLGLLNGAKRVGFDAQGITLDDKSLLQKEIPLILNILRGGLPRTVIYFGFFIKNKTSFVLIGDPVEGLSKLSMHTFKALLVNNAALYLRPNENFKSLKRVKNIAVASKLIHSDNTFFTFNVVICVVITLASISPMFFIHSSFLLDKVNIYRVSLIAILAIILRQTLSIIKVRISEVHSLLVYKNLMEQLYKYLHQLPPVFFKYNEINLLKLKYQTIFNINVTISNILNEGLEKTVALFTTLILMCLFSIKLVFPCVIVLCIYILIHGRKQHESNQNHSQKDSILNKSEVLFSLLLERMGLLKEYNKESYFSQQLTNNNLLYQSILVDLRNRTIQINSINTISLVTIASIILTSTYLNFLKGDISLHTFQFSIFLIFFFFFNLWKYYNTFHQIRLFSKANSILNDLSLISSLSKESIKKDLQSNIESIYISSIKMVNVKFTHIGYRIPMSLGSVFLFNRGEIGVIIGSKYSGKTTFTNILSGFLPYEGNILINGTYELRTLPREFLNKTIGLLPQVPVMFPGDILFNISFDESEYDKFRTNLFYHEFHFDQFFSNLPLKEHTFIGQGGVSLSSTQQQMLALARVVYKKPQVLVIDEQAFSKNETLIHFLSSVFLKIKLYTCIIYFTSNSNNIDIKPDITFSI